MGFLAGKRAVVIGLASNRSIAWGIAQAMRREGAELALSYQTEKLRSRVDEMAGQLGSDFTLPLDVADDAQIDAMLSAVGKEFGHLDMLVHSVAFARKEDLEGAYHDTSREGWRTALEISAYSLVAISGKALPLMKERGGSILTMTYIASQRVFPNYNVMGSAKAALEHAVRQLAHDLGEHQIRVNAVSAGPLSTLSARGVSGFTAMVGVARERAPLRRNIEAREVADASLFLLSPMGSGITGSIVYVDAGYHIMGI